MSRLSGRLANDLLLLLCGLFFATSCCAQACIALAAVEQPLATSLRSIGCETSVLNIEELVAKARSADCQKKGPRTVICNTPLRVDGLKNTTLDGGGWQITFSDPGPGKGGVVLNGARNVVVRNLKLGWLDEGQNDKPVELDKRIYSTGTIHACPGGGSALELDQGGDGSVPIAAVSKWSDKGWPWDIREPSASVERYFKPNLSTQFTNGNSSCIKDFGPITGRVLIRHYIYAAHAFSCYGCEMIAIEKVSIQSAPGMGFFFSNAGKGFVFRDNVIAPSCSPQCSSARPSIAADGIHFSGATGSILIERNDFGWQGDDSVNITGMLLLASVDKRSDNETWLRLGEQTRNRSWLLRKGTEIALFDRGLRILGTSQVLGLDQDGTRVKVSKLPPDSAELFVTATDRIPREVLIRNNRFHNHRARGILLGAIDATIENNVIERVTMAAIMIHADTSHWFEGPGAKNVKITGNKISQVNAQIYQPEYPSAISIGFQPTLGFRGPLGEPIQDVSVENNSFSNLYNSPDRPVHVGCGVTNAKVTGRAVQGECKRR